MLSNTFVRVASFNRSSSVRWASKISYITILGSAVTITGSIAGLGGRRRRLLIALGIGSGAGAAFGCFLVRRFRLGMYERLTSSW